jgi:hypothetical protein
MENPDEYRVQRRIQCSTDAKHRNNSGNGYLKEVKRKESPSIPFIQFSTIE